MPPGDHTGPLLLQVRTLRDANRKQRRVIESLRKQHDALNEALQETLVTLLSRGPLTEAVESALKVLDTVDTEHDAW